MGCGLPTQAIRDEGISYHYSPPDTPATATPDLVECLDDVFTATDFETHRGQTWSTSAYYRETIPEIEHYREEGVVSVCMESAAIWAVCEYRRAATATVHEIGDYLAPEAWTPTVEKERGLPEMLDPTVQALENYIDNM